MGSCSLRNSISAVYNGRFSIALSFSNANFISSSVSSGVVGAVGFIVVGVAGLSVLVVIYSSLVDSISSLIVSLVAWLAVLSVLVVMYSSLVDSISSLIVSLVTGISWLRISTFSVDVLLWVSVCSTCSAGVSICWWR